MTDLLDRKMCFAGVLPDHADEMRAMLRGDDFDIPELRHIADLFGFADPEMQPVEDDPLTEGFWELADKFLSLWDDTRRQARRLKEYQRGR